MIMHENGKKFMGKTMFTLIRFFLSVACICHKPES